ncbi:hypothetical protein EMIHUDRAFT_448870 [Emiliania huxleyi CCMP1516]|uniref:Phospholipase A-2-activating protein n=2 Tax=Emiliania huxleyi TaxID=2903 RepID=A0A0D3KUX7_EMIH1|nr:hypothetical protein EMIHUDRAFT_448870 [Emiliania huxleyi CCMP1516]EOD39562.1 hypothetical protein EMIHUDRAFT_448870 [Emiliania huxleyi CCMP1516]|eukprot:XP_005791991.1 hypothetical protein EMIHUDRAFT_448870 [Emiliania huxleyi CCMP1516]
MSAADPMPTEPFQLSAILTGHEQDVRSVGPFADGQVITGSRDATVRVWKVDSESADGASATCTHTLSGHTHFVGAVGITAAGEALSGSNDKHIIIWNTEAAAPAHVLQGHTEPVTCVRVSPSSGQLFSASWDKTARVWDLGSASCVAVLKGHEAALWAVQPLGEEAASDRCLTGGGDRTIKLWAGETCERTYEGHSDVAGFLSCSNDATVRMWELGGECLRVLQASETFLYSVSVLPGGEWLTCSEDRTVRVWAGGSDDCVQSITHPATVEGMVGDLDVSQLASEEALAQPGEREGQHKIVKDEGGTPMLYTWSMAKGTWEKIGEVTGSSGGTSLGKRMHGGKEYDYLFDIDINGVPLPDHDTSTTRSMLKLPFNRGDDPWWAAQQFLWNNDIDQAFLDQVANFVITNTPGNQVSSGPRNADPFTSGGSYRPAANGAGSSGANGGNADPFTSSGAYRPGAAPEGVPSCGGSSAPQDPWMRGAYTTAQGAAAAAAAAVTSAAAAAPPPSYVSFEAGKHDAALAKLLEFSAKLRDGEGPDLALDETQESGLAALVAELRKGGASAALALAPATLATFTGEGGRPGLLGWPAPYLFPALDLLRLALLRAARSGVDTLEPPMALRLTALLAPGSAAAAEKAAPLMALRGLANMAANPALRPLAAPHAGAMLESLSPFLGGESPPATRLAASSLLLNASSLLKDKAAAAADEEGLLMQGLSLVSHALATPSLEEEALFRVLCSLGALLETGAAAAETASSLDIESALDGLRLPDGGAPKVRQKLAAVRAALAKRSKQ